MPATTFCSFMAACPPVSTLFPYTTLFRSLDRQEVPHDRSLNLLVEPWRLPEPGSRGARLRPEHDPRRDPGSGRRQDRKSTRLNPSHVATSYAVFTLKKQRNPTPTSLRRIH